MKFVDLTGMKFGQMTAIRRVENSGRRSQWLWQCDCGNKAVVTSDHVKSGHTTSCGCAWERKCVKHGHGHDKDGKQTRTYKAWVNMRSRVNPSIEQYRSYYFLRGITVCDRWKNDFIAFLSDMGEAPLGKSLDRIDNDGNYEPSNCRWATAVQQSANQQRTIRVDFEGETVCLVEACKRAKIHPATVHSRLNAGMTVQEAMSTPVRKRTPKSVPLASRVLNQNSAWMLY
jgi:hypothetical protein